MSTDTRIGTELRGYRIASLLGRGGMSVVYLAEHMRLGRKVALKLLAPELAENESFRERFLRESRLAASIDHPNIVPIYDADEADGVLYIAMRYVEGTDLKRLIREEGRLEPTRAADVIGQVAEALDVAHERDLVHRDVKPANILLARRSGRDHCYLADFGLTKQASSISGLTGTGQLVGTVDYAAPEQIKGDAVDRRADVYSLGCVLYECLTGTPPYRRDSEMAVLWAHVQEPPPSLREGHPDLPTALDPVVATAMAKSPDERYQTAGELSRELRAVVGGEVRAVPRPQVRTADRLAATVTRLRRRPRVLIAIGAVAVAIVALIPVTLALVAGGGSGAKAPLMVAVNSVGIIDPSTNELVGQLNVGKGPGAITVGQGAVWAINEGDKTISRIDPKTSHLVGSFGIGAAPSRIAVGHGALWAVDFQTASMLRINPANGNSLDANIDLGACTTRAVCGSDVAIGEGAVWAINGWAQTILRISPTTNDVVARLHTANAEDNIAIGEGAVWIQSPLGVKRIDPHTNKIVATIDVPNQPTAIAVGAGWVWVLAGDDDLVWRVDPATNEADRTIAVGHRPSGIAVGEGAVWVANQFAGTVSRIDPATSTVVKTIRVGHSPTGIAAGAGKVWVTVQAP